jgi:septum formation protein
LGADTVVVLNKTILGKPRDHEEARSMLLCLNGKEHKVITGFCLLDPLGRLAHLDAVETLVRFKHLAKEEIEAYIATGEPLGKAGSYAIQGIGAFMVEGITGSYTNVVGLPICALVKALLAKGALKTFPLSP